MNKRNIFISKDNTLYRFIKSSERLPEPFKVVVCKVTPPSPDPRRDTELHWCFVNKNGEWVGQSKDNCIEWQEELTSSFLDEVRGEAWEAGQKRLKHEFHSESRTPAQWSIDEFESPDKETFISSFNK